MALPWTNPAGEIKETGLLTRDKPVSRIKKILQEIQAKVPLRVKILVKGLQASGTIQGNTLVISGAVLARGKSSPPPENPAGGDDTADGDGSGSGTGTTKLTLTHFFDNETGELVIRLSGYCNGVKINTSTSIPVSDCTEASDSSSGA